MYKLICYVPESHLHSLKEALFAAGAGRQGNYDRCCWQVLGQGQFRPLQGANPTIGECGSTEHVAEYRLEMLCPQDGAEAVVQALRRAHPYEEPAFDLSQIVSV